MLSGTRRIDENGRLEIGGVNAVELARQYGTPLIVYDVALIREKARAFKNAFKHLGMKAQVAYASKAFSSIAIFQLMDEEGMSLDVVSGGELYTALAAGFPPERIHFHGNNKAMEELEMAVDAGIGCFVVDNFHEFDKLEMLSKQKGKEIPMLIRITPGIEAHTHDYILTGQEDSKFGFDLQSGQVDLAIERAISFEGFKLLGIHSHIGSQIFETTGFVMAIDKIFSAMEKWRKDHGYVPSVLNVGGGFGIRYTKDDDPIAPSDYIKEIVTAVKTNASQLDFPIPEIWIEPGRSMVGDAGTTLYSIGSKKEIPGIRKYLAIDGGMSDNLRPALYQAKYEGILANRANEEPEEVVSIAGKCCESGDMLIWDLPLPKAGEEDILAVFATGAYGYSMANNYNRITRPAVVFVENGESAVVIKRETFEDLVRHDLPLQKKVKRQADSLVNNQK